jgi:hypothetical protein
MHLDEVCGMIISAYYKESGNSSCMSRQKLPCTRCGAHLSSTWRPGPCGTSSLCNACGVQYMVRGDRPRMIDMVMDESRVIWMERCAQSYVWFESSQADLKDPRVLKWSLHEGERVQFTESKKRNFADL